MLHGRLPLVSGHRIGGNNDPHDLRGLVPWTARRNDGEYEYVKQRAALQNTSVSLSLTLARAHTQTSVAVLRAEIATVLPSIWCTGECVGHNCDTDTGSSWRSDLRRAALVQAEHGNTSQYCCTVSHVVLTDYGWPLCECCSKNRQWSRRTCRHHEHHFASCAYICNITVRHPVETTKSHAGGSRCGALVHEHIIHTITTHKYSLPQN